MSQVSDFLLKLINLVMKSINSEPLSWYYFKRYKPKEVRKPRIFTADEKVDECPYCGLGRVLQKFSPPDLNSPERTLFDAQMALCKSHWDTVKHQREQFNKQKAELGSDQILIVQVSALKILLIISGFHKTLLPRVR